MKFKKINKLLAALAVTSLASLAAVKGAAINGDIHFKNGTATLDALGASATTLSNFTGVQTQQVTSTGDYASVTNSSVVTVKDLDFESIGYTGDKVIADFWTFTDVVSSKTYSFNLATITSSSWDGSAIVITGTGTAFGTGFSSYAGTFQLSTSGPGATISFSSVTEVPDSGTTTALLGLSMLGLAGAARRLRK
jgi:hypothetical protein